MLLELEKRKMKICRWKLKKLLRYLILVFFLSFICVFFLNETVHKKDIIYKALGSRNVNELAQPYRDTFLINNYWQKVTSDHVSGTEKDIFLVVVVTSMPGNTDRRNIIRATWMKYRPRKAVIVVFFTGCAKTKDIAKLQQESDEHGDLIVDDFDEHYYKLAIKSLRILKWFNLNLGNANFLVKTDDDVYINTSNLVEFLDTVDARIRPDNGNTQNQEPALNYLGGSIFSGRTPHTFNAFSKWYVPPDLWADQKTEIESITKIEYSHDGYPDYLEGNFYVISGHSVPLILNTSLELPLYHLEDVYLTGFIGSDILKIKHEDIPKIFTSSAFWPRLKYWYTKLTTNLIDVVVYHCDNDVNIIKQIYSEVSIPIT